MEIASEDLPFGINASYWDRLIAVMEIASEDRTQTTELTKFILFILFWYLIFLVQVKYNYKSSEESASGGVLEGDEIISSDRSLDYHS
jgi:hypothetical protein